MSDPIADKPVQMIRHKDNAKALVEAWEVDMWRGYGFVPEKGADAEPEVIAPTDDQVADSSKPVRGVKGKPAKG